MVFAFLLVCFAAVSVQAGCGNFNWGQRCIGYAHNTWKSASVEECQALCANKNAKGCCGATNFYRNCFWFGNNGQTSTRLNEGASSCTPSPDPYKCHKWTDHNYKMMSAAFGGRSEQDVCRLDAKGFYTKGDNANFPGCASGCVCCTTTEHAKWEPYTLGKYVEERVLLEHGYSEQAVCHATRRAWSNGDNRWGFGGCGHGKCCGLKGKRYYTPDISKYAYSYHCGSETTASTCKAAGGVWAGGDPYVTVNYPGCLACGCCKKGYKWNREADYDNHCISRSGGSTSVGGNVKDLLNSCCGYDEKCMPLYKCRKGTSYSCSPFYKYSIFSAFEAAAKQRLRVQDVIEAAFGLL